MEAGAAPPVKDSMTRLIIGVPIATRIRIMMTAIINPIMSMSLIP
jgi:hypothetical protein